MKIIIKINKTQKKLIESQSHTIYTGDGGKYYFMPYWFQETPEGKFFLHRLGDLPKELTDIIEEERMVYLK